jgi:hypothetical protein
LVLNNDVACSYLEGEWKSYDSFYFNMEDNAINYQISCNLPGYNGEEFMIEDGFMYIIRNNRKIVTFTILPLSHFSMIICHIASGEIYTMIRSEYYIEG